MKNTLLLLFLLLIFAQISIGQNTVSNKDTLQKNEFYSNEFKWRIIIPPGFLPQNAGQFELYQKQGTEQLSKGLNTPINDRAKQICSFKYGKFGYFEVNEHAFDKTMFGDFLASCKNIENEFYEGFKNQIPASVNLDTLHSTAEIDGLEFQYFKLQMSINDKVLGNMLFYSKLFGNKEFSVIIIFADKESGDTMVNAWKGSKFNKN